MTETSDLHRVVPRSEPEGAPESLNSRKRLPLLTLGRTITNKRIKELQASRAFPGTPSPTKKEDYPKITRD